MAELAGLPPPSTHGEHLNGTSLAPIFHSPDDTALAHRLKPMAFSQFAKGASYLDREPGHNWTNFTLENRYRRDQTFMMGYSVRVPSWRYTCWFGVMPRPEDGVAIQIHHIIGRELYDHRGDMGGASFDRDGEDVNVVERVEHAATVKQLHALVLDYIRLPTTTQY